MGGPKAAATRAGSHAKDTRFPADLYLEGSDQHRGWFHSSLLVSCMLNGVPPYKALLTHGFAVDGDGKKMSKSKGNVVAPQKVSDTLGAEDPSPVGRGHRLFGRPHHLRRNPEARRRKLPAHPQHAAVPARQHRRISTAQDAIAPAELLEIDRYAIAATRSLADAIEGDYSRYEFHLVVQRLQTFCSEDLGGFYLDVLKDRLYTAGTTSRARRSAQTALALIRDTLLKLMAPVLSFTAEEAWRIVHPQDADDLHRRSGPERCRPNPTPTRWSGNGRASWPCARPCRRRSKRCARPARSARRCRPRSRSPRRHDDYDALASLGDDLRFVMITSAATVAAGPALAVAVTASRHRKCDRCWHYRADVGADPAHPTICGALRRESFRGRRSAPLRMNKAVLPGCGVDCTGWR